MATWEDAPIVKPAATSASPRWASAPVVRARPTRPEGKVYEPTFFETMFGRDVEGQETTGIIPSIGETLFGRDDASEVAARLPGNIADTIGAQSTEAVAGATLSSQDLEEQNLRELLRPPHAGGLPSGARRDEVAARLAEVQSRIGDTMALAREARAGGQEARPAGAGILESGIQQGAATAAVVVPTALATGPVGSSALMGAMSGGQRYGELREAGVDVEHSGRSALLLGSLEAITEGLPAAALLKQSPGFAGLKGKLAEFFASELPGENINTIAGMVDDYANGLREDITAEDLMNAVSQTTIDTVLGGAVQVGSVQLLQEIQNRANAAAEARAAENDALLEQMLSSTQPGAAPAALPAPVLEVSPEGVAAQPGEHERAQRAAVDMAAQMGFTPDVAANIERLEERAAAERPVPAALPAPDSTLYVDEQGTAQSLGAVEEYLRAVGDAMAAARGERDSLGLTPDVQANIDRLEARKTAQAPLEAIAAPDGTFYVDEAGRAGTPGQRIDYAVAGNQEARAAADEAEAMGFTADVADAAATRQGRLEAAQLEQEGQRPRYEEAPIVRPAEGSPAAATPAIGDEISRAVLERSPRTAAVPKGGDRFTNADQDLSQPSIEDPDATYKPARAKATDADLENTRRELDEFQASRRPKGKSALEFLASKGGLSIADLEAEGIDRADMRSVRGFKRPFTKKGMTLDAAAELLHEAGYDVGDGQGGYSANRVLELIDDELRGKKRYPLGQEQAEDPDAVDRRREGQEQRAGDERRGPPPRDDRDRRIGDRRRRVGEMSREELERELTTSALTGLPNKRAYQEAERLPVQASLDVDSLKWVNDTMGHESGDQLLAAVGQAIREATDRGYHFSGDEFVIEGATQAEIREIMEEVGERLAKATIEVTKSDGEVVTLEGIGVSYGLGDTLNEADENLGREKQAREASGLRAPRGEQPAGASRRRGLGQGGEDHEGNAAAQADDEDVQLSDAPAGDRRGAWYTDATEEQRATLDKWEDDRVVGASRFEDLNLRPARESVNEAAQASFYDYEIVRGLVEVPIADLDLMPGYNGKREADRISALAELIKGNEEIEPIFVGLDPNGEAYVVEGQHRVRALQQLGYAKAPARVIVDMDERDDVKLSEDQGDLFGKNQTAQELADRARAKDARRSPNRDVDADTGMPGDLFTRRTQRDIEDVADVKPKRKGTRGEHVTLEGDKATREPAIGEDVELADARGWQRAEPEHTNADMMRAVRELFKGAKNAPTVKFVASSADLPWNVRDRIKLPPNRDVQGVYDPVDNSVYLNLDMISSPEQAKWIAAHEIDGHLGLRGFVGKMAPDARKQLDKALNVAAQNPYIDGLAEALKIERTGLSRLQSIEEALAELQGAHATGRYDRIFTKYGVEIPAAMRGEKPSPAKSRLKRAIDNFLARLGKLLNRLMGYTVSDEQIAELLEGARRYVRDGTTSKGDVPRRDNARPSKREKPKLAEAHHGSPHRFDEFKLEAIGTGEGAAAYGWGLYFAENPAIAEHYAEQLSDTEVKSLSFGPIPLYTNGTPFDYGPDNRKAPAILRKMGLEPTRDNLVALAIFQEQVFIEEHRVRNAWRAGGEKAARVKLSDIVNEEAAIEDDDEYRRDFKKALEDLLNKGAPIEISIDQNKNVYTVDVADDAIETMLDWELPIGDQPHVLKAAQEAVGQNHIKFAYWTREIQNEYANSDAGGGYSDNYIEGLVEEYSQFGGYGDRGQRVIDELKEIAPKSAEQFMLTVDRDGLGAIDPSDTGQTVYDALTSAFGSQQAASMKLLEHGIRGVKYSDAGSRDGWRVVWGNGKKSTDTFSSKAKAQQHHDFYVDDYGAGTVSRDEGTKNFVVFNPEDIRIKTVNGEKVTRNESDAIVANTAQDMEEDVQLSEGERSADDENAFIRRHKTGNIPSDAYDRHNKDLSWIGSKQKFGRLIKTVTLKGKEYEIRGSTELNRYTKLDENDEIMRGPDGMALMMSPEEIESSGRKKYDETIAVFDGDKAIAFAANEFGATGVFVQEDYQRRGIGLELLAQFRKENPKLELGQMTPQGENLVRAAYRRGLISEDVGVKLSTAVKNRRKAERRAAVRAPAGRRSTDKPRTAKGAKGYKAAAQRAIDTFNDKVGWRWGALGKLPATRAYLKERYESLGRIGRSQAVARSVYDAFKKATPAEARAVYEYLTNRGALASTIKNEKMRNDAIQTKNLIDAVGKRLVDEGMLSQQAYDDHAGEYLPRVYLKHLLGDRAVRAIGAGKSTSDMGYLKQRLSEEQLPKEVREVILGEITDPSFLASFSLGRTLRDLALIDFFKAIAGNKQWVPEGATVEWNGRDVSPFWLDAEAKQLRRRAEYYDAPIAKKARDVADKMEATAAKATEALGEKDLSSYRQIPDSRRYGVLRGLWVRREIYNDLVGQQAAPGRDGVAERVLGENGLLTGLTRAFKISKVVLNPPSQVRNFVSNLMLLQLSGVPAHRIPSLVGRAIKSLVKRDRYFDIYEKFGGTAATWQASEVREISQEWIRLKQLEKNPLSRMVSLGAAAVNKASNAYGLLESIGKLAKIIDAMEREGMSPSDAMLAAHDALFDYSLVHPNVRYLRNNPLGAPFMTFQYKVLPALAKTAIKHPLRFAPYAAIPFLLLELLMRDYDVDDDDVEKLKNAFPAWMRERGQMLLLPWKDDQGRWQVADMGYLVPWGLPADLYATAKEDPGKAAKNALQQVALGGPLTDVAAAIETNVDPFTGREIVNPADPPADKLRAMMLYAWNLAMPGFMTERGAIPQTIRAAQGNVNNRGEPGQTVTQAALRMFGINVYPVDPEATRAANLRSLRYEQDEMRARANELLRNRNLSDAERAEIRETWRKLLEDNARRIQEYDESAEIHPNLRAQ